jgi:glutamine synthetase
VTISGNDPAKSFNVEYRAADATANPYLALAAIVRAGLEGLKARLPCPPVHSGDPDELTEADRAELGLRRLPETLEDALEALQGDPVVASWFPKVFLDTFTGMKAFEIKSLEGLDEEATCASYRAVY